MERNLEKMHKKEPDPSMETFVEIQHLQERKFSWIVRSAMIKSHGLFAGALKVLP